MTGRELFLRLEAAVRSDAPATSDFDLNPEFQLSEGRKLREAAVLVAVQCVDDDARLILTKRASGMKHHPGQIAFPGGKVDEGDADHIDAALREAEEEVALPRDQVRIIGTAAQHETVTSFRVRPVLAEITRTFTPKAEPGEVAEVFSVPLAHVLDPANYLVQSRYWQRHRRYYHTVPYGPYYIWGATARILRAMADLVAK